MKQTTNKPLHQMSVQHKIVIAFGIPLMTTLIVVIFALTGFKQIGVQNRAIREKLAQSEETGQQAEIFKLLEESEKRIRLILWQLIVITLISTIITTMIAVFIARTIPLQAGGSGLPEDARQELAAMRQKVDEILRRY